METIVAFLVGVAASVLAAMICALTLVVWRKRTNPFRRVLGVSPSYPLTFAFPKLPPPDGDHLTVVASEDMLAMHEIETALIRAEFPREKVDKKPADEVNAAPQNNLVLICSPKRNAVTAAVLNELAQRKQLDCRFVRDADNRWSIIFEGGPFGSPSYDQEAKLKDEGANPAAGPLTDVALLARVRNPWNPAATVIIVSGLRAFGTWGAADYLHRHVADIYRRTKGHDFAMLVEVTTLGYGIHAVKPTAHAKRL